MKEYFKKIICIAVVLCMVISMFSACGRRKYEQDGEVPTFEIETSNKNQGDSSKGDGKLNPLTGEYTLQIESVNKKPFCIFTQFDIKNTNQRGLSSPDVVIQDVNGEKLNMMWLYSNSEKIPRIDTVSSPFGNGFEIAGGMDSLFVYYGKNPDAENYIKTAKLSSYDVKSDTVTGVLGSIADGKVIVNELKKQSADTKIKSDGLVPYVFTKNIRVPFGDMSGSCSSINMHFSNEISQTFKYNADKKVYYSYTNNKGIKDGNNGAEVAYTNIIILYCQKTKDGKWDFAKGGDAVYVSNGYGERDFWKKENATSPLKLYGKDGKTLTSNKGKTWIGIIDNNNRHMTSINE